MQTFRFIYRNYLINHNIFLYLLIILIILGLKILAPDILPLSVHLTLAFYKNDTPIPTNSLRGLLRLILQENSFQFNGRNYIQTNGTAMGTKIAVAFANIFMSAVETEIISKSKIKPLEWKRYIDDVFSLWDTKRQEIDQFILEANRHHPTIKFTAEISEEKTNFLDTTIFKGDRFTKIQSLTSARTLNRLRHFNTHISLPVTLQA